MSLLMTSVQLFSHVRLFVTPWTTACQASLSITNSQSSPKPMSIESMMPSNHLILCCPLLLLPSIFPSIRIFSSESALRIRWPKYWSFSFSISPSIEYSGLISFRIDWFDLLAVQGTLKSLLQHHSSRALILEQTRMPREFDYRGQWDLITELPQDWGNRLLEGTDQILCTPGARIKEQWKKGDRDREIYDITCMWNQKKMFLRCRWTYLQNRNRPTDIENKFMVSKGKREREG